MTEQKLIDGAEALNGPSTADRPFNPGRGPRSSNAATLVNDVIGLLENYETHLGTRKRKRKVADQETFAATVTAITCDLVHLHLTGAPGAIYVSRSNQELGSASRYRAKALNKRFPYVLDLLAAPEMGLLIQQMGAAGDFSKHRRSTILPAPRLVLRIEQAQIGLDDLGITNQGEIIQLKSAKDGFWGKSKLVEYHDDGTTQKLRAELSSINRWLDQSIISFDPIVLTSDRDVDDRQRALRRAFTQGSFEFGGRLWGGFWYGLSGKDRLNGIQIGGEPVVELDYGQMSVRIVYGMQGGIPDFDDAYDIPGYSEHRQGIKQVVNSMLFSSSRLTRMPKGVRKDMDIRHKIGAVMSAIEALHEPIRSSFFVGIGHRAQRVESDILVAVLQALQAEGVPALPVHDAILVPQSATTLARSTMLAVFRSYAGVDGVVRETTLADLLAKGGVVETRPMAELEER